MAYELKYPFFELIASEINNISELVDLITDNERSLIFLDEIHGLPRSFVEPLYPLMEDFRHDGQQISPFTLIGATTEIGEIVKTRRPFYDRFVLKQELEDYLPSHIQKIIYNFNIKKYNDTILDPEIHRLISLNARNTPRVALSMLESAIYLNGNINAVLKSSNIICNGYTRTDLKALQVIAKHNRGIGVQGLCAFLNVSIDTYMYQIEPYLLKTHCILRTSKGRQITPYGVRIIKKLESV